jgi:signal transduction histidine kinase
MSSTPVPADQPEALVPNRWKGRLIPIFWTVVFGVGLALTVLGLIANHPERVSGWRGAGLGALLAVFTGAYQWFAWRRIYRDGGMSERRGLIALTVQLLALLLLAGVYEPAFGWFNITLLYEIVGGLPRRRWPLLGAVLLALAASMIASGGDTPDWASGVISVLLFIFNIGIALSIRLLNEQRDQLRDTLAQLRAAHAELAAGAAQQEELAVLRERARLARALHDNIGHALVVMNVKLEAAQLLYARDPARGDGELEETRALIRSTMAELRRALANLRAPSAPHDDLPAALQRLAHELQARAGVATRCAIPPGLPAPPAEAREALWYVAREALANVERHARAATATLSLEHEPDGWRLRVTDDGAGVSPASLDSPQRYGVVGMRERMQAAGGSLRLGPGPAGGTVVEAWLPVQTPQETRAE